LKTERSEHSMDEISTKEVWKILERIIENIRKEIEACE
jgi:hypothetical protein